MHFNRQSNDLTENELNCQTFFNHKSLTRSEDKTATKSGRQPDIINNKKEKIEDLLKQNEKSVGEKCVRLTTTSNSSDSTDSGVNLSDNDDLPPTSHNSSKQLLHSFETNSIAASHCYKKFQKHNKNTTENHNNNVNNKATGNDSRNVINNYNTNRNIINYNNDVDDDKNENIHSQNFDNKFKVTNSSSSSSNEGNNTRYQQKTENCINTEVAANTYQQRNLEILNSTPQPIATTAAEHNDKPSFQHNEFIHPQQRYSPTTSSSLSLSSSASTCDNNPPSKMQHCKGSPVVSIRSINSAIITSDSDSDSELNSDAESYVIKKLGTQLTYPPNDPALPNINSGRTLLNQKVIANSNQAPLPPLEALAVIGDRIGAAQALGPLPSVSGVAQRPQIGSIALSNSSDVTFGDKHFYEGPVTIQQFLIDGRDKWKETNGKDNPTFFNENSEATANNNNAKDINPDAEKSHPIYQYIVKHKRMVIPGVLAFTTLLIVASIWGSKLLAESKSKLVFGNDEESRNIIPINSSIAQDNFGGGYVFRMVPRGAWLAQPPINPPVKLDLPVDRVIIIPTRTAECETQAACIYTVRITQTYNIESQRQDDIIYNFLIGGDGNVYEGRGWDIKGSVIKGFNDNSLTFAFIGSFKKQQPSYKQLNITKLLLEEGVRLKKLTENYRIVGANKLDPTSVATSADALYKSFENWPHWSDH